MNILLASSHSKSIGLGHFSRMLSLHNSLERVEDFTIHFSVLGDKVLSDNLKNTHLDIISEFASDYFQLVRDFIRVHHIKLFIMDFHKSTEGPELIKFFKWAKANSILLVAVDSFINYREYLDHIWLPSVYFDLSKISKKKGLCDVTFGWDHFLLTRHEPMPNWQAGGSVLVMTGGGDVLGLGAWLPELLDEKLMPSTTVNWIKGPYANCLNIPINSELDWNIYENPKDIDKLISQSNYVLTQFGVSFFESVQYGIPTVVIPLNISENNNELDLIKREKVALVAKDAEQSVSLLVKLMNDDYLAKKLSNNSKKKMHMNGCDLLINKINKLMRL